MFRNGVLINKTLTVNACNHTVDADNSNRIFNITSPATLNNIKLINGLADEGGAVYTNATLTINNSTFNSNTASKKGGAIYNNGTLTITNTTFFNNKIADGSTYDESRTDCNGGGAIFTKGALTVKTSNFTQNTAPHAELIFTSGGAIYVFNTTGILIDDCIFERNSAVYAGAVLFEKFSQDTAAIKNSVFNSNQAWQGGAVYANEFVGKFIIENSNFTANKAVTPNAGSSNPLGGAVMVGTKSTDGVVLEISECNFNDNTAYRGGAVCASNNNEITISKSNFTNNSAQLGGALITGQSSTFTITESLFTNNNASSMGGAIFAEPSSSTSITNSNFAGNVGNGRDVMNYMAQLELSGNQFSKAGVYNYKGTIKSELLIKILDNETKIVSSDNITLYASITDKDGNIIRDSTFKFKINDKEIDAVYDDESGNYKAFYAFTDLGIYLVNMTSNNPKLTIQTGAFKNIKGTYTDLQYKIGNTTDGVLNLDYDFKYSEAIDGNDFADGVLIDKEITINGNGHTINGVNKYRIFKVNKKAVLNNIKFINGSAAEFGGAIYASADLTVTDSVFDGNDIRSTATSGEFGGSAIFSGAGTTLTIKSSNFTNNNKNYVDGEKSFGAVAAANILVIEDSYFAYNKGRWGGAVSGMGYLDTANTGKVTINNTLFEYNTAHEGGAVFTQKSNLIIDNSTFTNNNAYNGGAVLHDSQKTEGIATLIINSTFDSNSATSLGSAINALSAFKYIDCNFTNNKAPTGTSTVHYCTSNDGSGDANYENSLILRSKFENNLAYYYGAIYFKGTKSLTINESQFTNNTGSTFVGAILFQGKDLTVTKSNFTNNKMTSGYAGALYFSSIGVLTLNESKFTDNIGSWAGAVMVYVGNANIVDSEFKTNNASTYASALYVYGNKLNITRSNFTDNKLTGTSGFASVYLRENVNAIVKDSIFAGSGKYELYNSGELYLNKNTVSNIIYSNGKITSKVNITILNNLSVDFIDSVDINAVVVDDNGNIIQDAKFTLTVDNVAIATSFNDNLYTATYTQSENGIYTVSMKYFDGADLNIKTATLRNIKGTFTDLQNKIKDAGETLTLPYAFAYNEVIDGDKFKNGVLINKTLTVDGKGFTVDAKNSARIFNITAEAKLNNITFTNAKAAEGAAVYANVAITVNNSVFTGNNASTGASIYLNNASFKIYNTNFTSNSAVSAAAIYASNIKTESVIDGCLFKDNTADETFSAIYIDGKAALTVNNTEFINNTAHDVGVIYYNAEGKLSILNSNFTNNSINNGNASAIYLEKGSAEIVNAVFNNNTDSGAGETIFINTGVELTLKDSRFINQNAGCEIVNDGILSLENNVINKTTAKIKNNKGNITSKIKVTVLNHETVTIDNFNADLFALITDDEDNLFIDANFKFTIDGKVLDTYYQDGLYKKGYELSFAGIYPVSVQYVNNNALNISGGSIKCIKGTYTDLQNQINATGDTLNLAYNFKYLEAIDGENFPNGVLINKELTINGNGFIISGDNKYRIFNITNKATLNNIKFINGSAAKYGGAIYASADLTVNDSVFDGNDIRSTATSGEFGGSAILAAKGVTLTVSNSNFTNNGLSYRDTYRFYGAVGVYDKASFDNCIFANNKGRWGGAITGVGYNGLHDGSAVIKVNNSKFESNFAFQGAGIYAEETYLIVDNSQFINSNHVAGSATGSGATAVYASAGAINALSTITITNSNFTDNYAQDNGGALYYYGINSINNDCLIDNCIFKNNKAGKSYGAVYFFTNYGENLTVSNSKFINNTAQDGIYQSAGALFYYKNNLNIINTEFRDNTGYNGGAVYYSGKTLTVTNSNFTGNNASHDGGAIYLEKGNSTITGSIFKNNKAQNGSAVYVTSNAKADITANFTNNNVTAIYNLGNITVKNSVFTGNDDYAIFNDGDLYLNNNTVSNFIYNTGNILTKLNATLINNDEVAVSLGDTVKPTATLVDDNNNAVYDPLFKITVHGTVLDNTVFDKENKIYSANYTIVDAGENIVNTTYTSANLTVKAGSYIAPRANVTLEITAVSKGENATIIIVLKGVNSTNLTDNVTLVVNNIQHVVKVIDGLAEFNVTGLAPGSYSAVASVEANSNYNSKINSTIFFIKSDTILTIIVDNIKYCSDAVLNVTLTDAECNNLSGMLVTVTIDGKTYDVVIDNGKGITLVKNLKAGDDYNASAVFAGSDYYYASNSSDLFTVSKYTPVISVKADNVTYPDKVIVTLLSDTTGNYTVKVGDIETIVLLYAGISQNLTYNLKADVYNINVSYVVKDTQNFTESVNDTVDVEVLKAEGLIVVSDVVNVTYPDDFALEYAANATVKSVKVTTRDGDAAEYTIEYLDNKLLIKGLNSGDYTLNITVSDENHTDYNLSLNFTVNKVTPAIKVTSTDVTYNSSVVVYVTSNVAGTYTVKLGESEKTITLDGINTVNATFTGLKANEDGYKVNVTYTAADSNHNNAFNDSVVVKVFKAKSIVNITSTADGVYNTTNATINVEFANKTDVTFSIIKGSEYVAYGDWSNVKETLSKLDSGEYTINILNSGDENHTSSSAQAVFTIAKIKSLITIEDLGDLYYGREINVVFTVSNKTTLTYTVKTKDGEVVVENTTVADSIVLPLLNVSDYTITLANAEETNVAGDVKSLNFTINKATPVINVTADNTVYGMNITVKINTTVSGDYNVSVGNVSQKVFLNSSIVNEVNFTLPISEEAYLINVTCEANTNYEAGFNDTVSVYVFKAPSVVVINNITNGTYSLSNATFNITYSGGNLSANITQGNITVKADIALDDLNAVLWNLSVGEYNITFTNTGDENHTSSNATALFSINKVQSKVIIADIPDISYGSYYKLNVTVEYLTNATYTIKLQNGTVVLENETFNGNITLPLLSVGNYTVIILNNETENVIASNASANFTVVKSTPQIFVNVTDITYGEVLTVIVNTTIAGDYKVVIGNITRNVTLAAGVNELNFTDIKASESPYNIKVWINETDDYASAVNDTESFMVLKAPSSINLVNVINGVYNTTTTAISINCTNGTNITFTFNKDVLPLSALNSTLSALNPGDYNITFTNNGDENHTSSNVDVAFKVLKASSKVTIDAVGNVTYLSVVKINYSVLNRTSVSVYLLKTGGSPIPVDNITDTLITIAGLDTGKYTLAVSNSENDKYEMSYNTIEFSVLKANSSVVINPVKDTVYGENITVNYTLTNYESVYVEVVNTDTGAKYSFSAGDYDDKSAVIIGLDAGNYTVTVTINDESSNYNEEFDVAYFKVLKSVPHINITVLNITYGENIIVSAISDVTGEYVVKVGDETQDLNLEAGVVKNATFGGFNTGKYDVTVSYPETKNYNSTFSESSVVVFPATSSVVINPITNVTLPDSIKITYEVVNATKVVIKVLDFEGKEVGYTIDSTGVLYVSAKAGNYTINITNTETLNVKGSSATAKFTIIGIPDFNITATSTSPVYGEDAVVTVTLPDDATGEVKITVGDKTFNGTVKAGKASVNVSDLDIGDNLLTAVYSGDANYASKSVNVVAHIQNIVVVAPDMVRGYNSGMDYQARLVDEQGRAVSGWNVTLIVENANYTLTSDADGYISVNAGLTIGSHSVVVIHPVTGRASAAVASIVTRITANKNVNMEYDDGTTYKVRIIGDDGNYAGAGEVVSFILNGKKMTAKTDKNGYAAIKVSLAPGQYSVSAEYKGVKVSNKVVVKSHFISKYKVTYKKSKINRQGYLLVSYKIGKYFVGKKVTLVFANKKYTQKVAKNGKVKFKVAKKVVNKLKVGKTYKYKLTYKLDSKTRNIKVYKTKIVFISTN